MEERSSLNGFAFPIGCADVLCHLTRVYRTAAIRLCLCGHNVSYPCLYARTHVLTQEAMHQLQRTYGKMAPYLQQIDELDANVQSLEAVRGTWRAKAKKKKNEPKNARRVN